MAIDRALATMNSARRPLVALLIKSDVTNQVRHAPAPEVRQFEVERLIAGAKPLATGLRVSDYSTKTIAHRNSFIHTAPPLAEWVLK